MGNIITENVSVEELLNNDESIEKNNKQLEYLDYIKEHVLNVQKAFYLHFLPLLESDHISEKISDETFKDAIKNASTLVIEHDASKYGDEEFDGYREKYYPTAREKSDPEFEEKAKERSEIAWIHHYSNNPHHPMYWVNKETNEPIDMELSYIIEMICDWEAMSMKYRSDTQEWYKNKAEKEKRAMTNWTKDMVEEILFNVIYH